MTPPLPATYAVTRLRFGMCVQDVQSERVGAVVEVSADRLSGVAQFKRVGRKPITAAGVLEIRDDAEGWGLS